MLPPILRIGLKSIDIAVSPGDLHTHAPDPAVGRPERSRFVVAVPDADVGDAARRREVDADRGAHTVAGSHPGRRRVAVLQVGGRVFVLRTGHGEPVFGRRDDERLQGIAPGREQPVGIIVIPVETSRQEEVGLREIEVPLGHGEDLAVALQPIGTDRHVEIVGQGGAVHLDVEFAGLAVAPVLRRGKVILEAEIIIEITRQRGPVQGTQGDAVATQHGVIHLQGHRGTGRNVQHRVGPQTALLPKILAVLFGILVCHLEFVAHDLVGPGPFQLPAIQAEMHAAHRTSGNTRFMQGLIFATHFESGRIVHAAGEIDRETVIDVDVPGGIVLEPVGHPHIRVRQPHLDVEILAHHLHLRHLHRDGVAGTDAGGIGNDRIAVGMQQARKRRQDQKGKDDSFHIVKS